MAEGSHAVYAGWEPRVCSSCGEPIRLTGKHARGAVFRRGLLTDTPTARHPDCPRLPLPRLLEPDE